VLAKTTGSEAQFILPDGKEEVVRRRGITSIIEQKKLLRKAKEFQADSLVAEVMSIHPENHYIETQRILKPNIILITNIRKDHTDAMGITEDEIASVFSLDITEGGTVIIPEKELKSYMENTIVQSEGTLLKVREGVSSPVLQLAPDLKEREFSENLDLIFTLCRLLNVKQESILRGTLNVKHDIGNYTIWKYIPGDSQKLIYLVNAFAANDPQSTYQIISKVREILPASSKKFVGFLNLRTDRGERTLQWIESLNNCMEDYFSRIYVTGIHSQIVKRKVKGANILNKKKPEEIMKIIINEMKDNEVLFGFGNIKGTGKDLIEYWKKAGEKYGL